jgi:hypothetical protein
MDDEEALSEDEDAFPEDAFPEDAGGALSDAKRLSEILDQPISVVSALLKAYPEPQLLDGWANGRAAELLAFAGLEAQAKVERGEDPAAAAPAPLPYHVLHPASPTSAPPPSKKRVPQWTHNDIELTPTDSSSVLLSFPTDPLKLIVAAVDRRDTLALALTSRKLCKVVFERHPKTGSETRLTTPVGAAVMSVARLKWALALPCSKMSICWMAAHCPTETVALEMMQLARAHGCPFSSFGKETTHAAAQNHGALLSWLVENGCQRSVLACAMAAKNQHFGLLESMVARDFPMDQGTADGCALHGNLQMLKVVTKEGKDRCGDLTFACAVKSGNLSMVEWMYEKGRGDCGEDWWRRRELANSRFAAERGHLDILKCLRSHGCNWAPGTCRAARRNGHEDLLIWAIEAGCPDDDDEEEEEEEA